MLFVTCRAQSLYLCHMHALRLVHSHSTLLLCHNTIRSSSVHCSTAHHTALRNVLFLPVPACSLYVRNRRYRVLFTSPFAALRACAEAGMSLGGLTVGTAVALARVYAATRLQTAWRGHYAVSCTEPRKNCAALIMRICALLLLMCIVYTIRTVYCRAVSVITTIFQVLLGSLRILS
jgi:hypothetical protein